MTSSVSGNSPLHLLLFRYLRAEFVCPCTTNLANIIFALSSGLALLILGIRVWIDRPLHSRLSISPSFHSPKRHSHWSFAIDFMLGFCSAVANKTIALRAICCPCHAFFHSVMCCVSWLINCSPTLPYGTRKVFLHHSVISL